MTYLLVDDRFPEHPKIEELSDRAFRLHMHGLCYCSRNLTDGFIPKAVAHRFVRKASQICLELVQKRVWIQTEIGYEIHDYLDWNKSRAEIQATRKANQAAGRKGAQTRWHPDSQRHGERYGERHGPPTLSKKKGLDLGVESDCDEASSPLEAARLVKSVNGHLDRPLATIRKQKCTHEMQRKDEATWKCQHCGLEQVD